MQPIINEQPQAVRPPIYTLKDYEIEYLITKVYCKGIQDRIMAQLNGETINGEQIRQTVLELTKQVLEAATAL